MFLCFHLQVKLLASLCVRSEIDQIIRYVPLIYAFQIPEDIDQGSIFGSKRKPNGNLVRDHNFDKFYLEMETEKGNEVKTVVWTRVSHISNSLDKVPLRAAEW